MATDPILDRALRAINIARELCRESEDGRNDAAEHRDRLRAQARCLKAEAEVIAETRRAWILAGDPVNDGASDGDPLGPYH